MQTKKEECIIPKQHKTGTATNPTVETQLKALETENAELKETNQKLADDVKKLKVQLHEANLVLERDLKTDLLMRIKSKSLYTDAQLDGLTIQQLQQIDSTLSMTKDPGTFKNIRAAGASSPLDGRLTVGGLHGLSREQILKLDSEE